MAQLLNFNVAFSSFNDIPQLKITLNFDTVISNIDLSKIFAIDSANSTTNYAFYYTYLYPFDKPLSQDPSDPYESIAGLGTSTITLTYVAQTNTNSVMQKILSQRSTIVWNEIANTYLTFIDASATVPPYTGSLSSGIRASAYTADTVPVKLLQYGYYEGVSTLRTDWPYNLTVVWNKPINYDTFDVTKLIVSTGNGETTPVFSYRLTGGTVLNTTNSSRVYIKLTDSDLAAITAQFTTIGRPYITSYQYTQTATSPTDWLGNGQVFVNPRTDASVINYLTDPYPGYNLPSPAALNISGGSNGQYIGTDGSGNLTWQGTPVPTPDEEAYTITGATEILGQTGSARLFRFTNVETTYVDPFYPDSRILGGAIRVNAGHTVSIRYLTIGGGGSGSDFYVRGFSYSQVGVDAYAGVGGGGEGGQSASNVAAASPLILSGGEFGTTYGTYVGLGGGWYPYYDGSRVYRDGQPSLIKNEATSTTIAQATGGNSASSFRGAGNGTRIGGGFASREWAHLTSSGTVSSTGAASNVARAGGGGAINNVQAPLDTTVLSINSSVTGGAAGPAVTNTIGTESITTGGGGGGEVSCFFTGSLSSSVTLSTTGSAPATGGGAGARMSVPFYNTSTSQYDYRYAPAPNTRAATAPVQFSGSGGGGGAGASDEDDSTFPVNANRFRGVQNPTMGAQGAIYILVESFT